MHFSCALCAQTLSLVGDGAYACVRLAWVCRTHHVTLIARLRLDARLYASPEPVPSGKQGPQPRKGAHSEKAKVECYNRCWQKVIPVMGNKIINAKRVSASLWPLGSAALMPRNLDRRVEMLFPVEDPCLRQTLATPRAVVESGPDYSDRGYQ